MTTDQPGSDPHLTTWLAAVDTSWRRSQIPGTDHQLTTRSVVVVALLGAAAGAALAWLILYPVAFSVMDSLALSYAQEGLVAYALHGVSAVICAAVASLAVWWRFRFTPGIRRTALLTGLFLLLAGALSVLPTIALATALSYSTATSVVALEIAVVACFCARRCGRSLVVHRRRIAAQ